MDEWALSVIDDSRTDPNRIYRKCWLKVPNMDLKNRLRPLQRDVDILAMTSHVPNFRVIEVYIEKVEDYVDENVNVPHKYNNVGANCNLNSSGFEDSGYEDFVDKGSDDDAINNEEFDENVNDFDELLDTS
ncbi:hypothetical protein LguiA_020405 [Lonicera macranthoides]